MSAFRVKVCGALAIATAATSTAAAQIPDSVVWARLDSSSICPTVSVQLERGVPGGLITTSPIYHRVSSGDLAFVVGAIIFPSFLRQPPQGMLSFNYMREGSARYDKSHEITITADDSIRILAETSYGDRSTRPDFHFEDIRGRVTSYDLSRLANAKRITVMLGNESYPLSVGQVQALRAVVAEVNKPLSEREVPTGCVGPKPAELASKWGIANARPGALMVRRPTSRNGRPFFEFQVEKPVSQLANNPPPVYPAALKAARVGGEVLAQFVVLEDGTVDPATITVIRSSNDLFSQAVLDVVPQMRFLPAEIGGKKVKQLAQLPFEFKVNK